MSTIANGKSQVNRNMPSQIPVATPRRLPMKLSDTSGSLPCLLSDSSITPSDVSSRNAMDCDDVSKEALLTTSRARPFINYGHLNPDCATQLIEDEETIWNEEVKSLKRELVYAKRSQRQYMKGVYRELYSTFPDRSSSETRGWILETDLSVSPHDVPPKSDLLQTLAEATQARSGDSFAWSCTPSRSRDVLTSTPRVSRHTQTRLSPRGSGEMNELPSFRAST